MPNTLIKFIICLLTILGLSGSLANAADEPNCESPSFQLEMNHCAYLDYLAADKELNIQYKLARTASVEMDADQPDQYKGASDALLYAQRAWLRYRDLACESAGFTYRGGSLESFIVSSCKADLTRRRTQDLHDLHEINDPS